MIPIVLSAMFLIFVGLVLLLENTLYKNCKEAIPASKSQFEAAVDKNLFWENFSDKRATFGKIVLFLFVIIVLLFCLGIVLVFGIPGMLIPYYDHEWFHFSFLFSPIAGAFPAVIVILLFQNNPIRWLLAVRKYEQGKVIFTEEHDDAS